MGAKSYFFIILVALTIGFVLIPTVQAEDDIEITSIQHNYARIENSIDLEITNGADEEVSYSLLISVFSEDLQETIELESANLVFSLDPFQTYQNSFQFTIPRSGNYVFNLTLLSNGEITTTHSEYQYVFYENTDIQLDNIIQDYYLDLEGTNWRYDDENEQLELINLEDDYETGVVLGPFDTKGSKSNVLEMEMDFDKTESSNFTIAYTTDFDSEQLYSTEWNAMYSLDEATTDNIELGLIEEANVYIRLLAIGTNADETNFWFLKNMNHRYVTSKHDLEVTIDKHYFYTTDLNPEIFVDVENTGLFDQQLGNISIVVDLYSIDGYIESYSRTPNLLSGDSQTLDFELTGIDSPGNYYCKTEVTLVKENIYVNRFDSFISVSLEDLGTFNLTFENPDSVISIVSDYNQLNLLVESSNIDELSFSSPFEKTNLLDNYYLISITDNNGDLLISSENPGSYGSVLSTISMDQYRFSVQTMESSGETIEGITAPSVTFVKTETYTVNIILNNEGFYTEEYSLSYIFAGTFIDSISGPDKAIIGSGQSTTIEIEINPLPKIPREGGSQLNIDISNGRENKILTYILSYENSDIEVLDQSCNRRSVLLGQSISCTTVITNNGYVSGSLDLHIGIENGEGNEIIEQVLIDKLENGESWSVRTTYKPENDGKYQMFVSINDDSGLIASYQMEPSINVVTPAKEPEETIPTFSSPKLNFTRGLFGLSFLGMGYQFRRSENFKYLAFKFFIPLYSRLQKDTLADEPTRQKLLRHIYSEPGANFTELKEGLGLHNGTLAHHIYILENHQMITSQKSGRQRLFFPFGSTNKAGIRTLLITNETQKEIIKIVKENPGITQSMISQRLDVSRQKINYHVNSLVANSILNLEKQGRITRLYPTHFT
jgi:DNA-binding MarR family transcriptional regulator